MIAAGRGSMVGDRWLLLAVLGLTLLGTLMVHAIAPESSAGLDGQVTRRLVYLGIGAGAMFTASRLDYHVLGQFSPAIYVAALLLLVAVLVLGTSEYGAQRWIAAGPINVQPAELAKLSLAIAGVALMASREPVASSTLLSLGLYVLPLGLVLLQPDLGTTVLLAIVWGVTVVVWGVPWRLVGALAGTAIGVLPLAFALAVPDYQRERLAVFLDPERDPLGSGFTLRQVEVALGSGGLRGHGFFSDAASALDGVAPRTADFAFAQIGEQAGLIGSTVILGLFLVIAWRGFRAASVAPDRFGRLLATALTATIVLQAAIHIAVNLRFFPATGIPLPFVSQGGSALVAMCIAAGILQGIAAQRPATAREQWSAERWR